AGAQASRANATTQRIRQEIQRIALQPCALDRDNGRFAQHRISTM
ncbi:hypothetical protein, partial [Pseudomonas fluorescens]